MNILWSPGTTLAQVEEQVIVAALSFFRGNKSATATALGVSVRTLDNKLERYMNEKEEREMAEAFRKEEREALLLRARGQAPAVSVVATSVILK